MRLTALATLMLLGLAAPGAAPAQKRPPLPALLLQQMAELDGRCRAAGGRPGKARYIVARDFTGEGTLDYLLSQGDYGCDGRPGLFRGDGEALVELYVTDRANRATRAFAERLIAYRVLDGRPARVQIARRGEACGPGAGATQRCAAELAWTGSGFGERTSVGTAPAASPAAPSPPAPAAGVAPGAEAAFKAACKRDILRANASAASWVDRECAARWRRVEASGPAAQAVLALLPAPGERPARAALVARPSGIAWAARPGRNQLATGRIGGLTAALEGQSAPAALSFSWNATGAEIPWDLPGALRARGATIVERACQRTGTGEGERIYAGTMAGRAPFTLTVGERTAPTGGALSWYAATVSLDGRHPARGGATGCEF